MKGVPASIVYDVPTTVGFAGHTLTKQRLPATTIGLKNKYYLDLRPGGRGPFPNLRDKTHLGKSNQTNYHFSRRPKDISERNPAPNFYYPKMDSVLKKSPMPSIKKRTHFGCPDISVPGPNAYTLRKNYPEPCKTPYKSVKPLVRIPFKSEFIPAPNVYRVPSTSEYKHRKSVAVTMTPIREPVIKQDPVPPPNFYNNPRPGGARCAIKGPSFGQKPSYKRIVYVTYGDIKRNK